MNAYQMEDWVHVHKTVPTQLDHSSAAVFQGTLYLVMPAMVRMVKNQAHLSIQNTTVQKIFYYDNTWFVNLVKGTMEYFLNP